MHIRTSDALLYAVIAVAMACAVGLLGYRVGHVTADASGAYVRGVTSGERAAQARADASYANGGPGHRRIFAAGRKAGRRGGYVRGRRAGLKVGRSQGFDRGASSAFTAFPDWRAGAWYVVRVADGPGRARFTIPERVVVEHGRAYRMCSRTARRICHSAAGRPVALNAAG